jgi:tripartite-type tricarboxylate transporter receptor subunit TctC
MPTVNETLPNNVILPSWFALLGPAGMPREAAALLQKEVKLALEQPNIAASWMSWGLPQLVVTQTDSMKQFRPV